MASDTPSGDATPRLPYGFAKQHGFMVLDETDGQLRVGRRAGASALLLPEVRRALGRAFDLVAMDRDVFDRSLSEVYAGDGLAADAVQTGLEQSSDGLDGLIAEMPDTADLLDTMDDAPMIRLINGLIAEAARKRASDIHVEPYETHLSVRLRIDGVLTEALSLSPKVTPVLVSRIKVMARLDIAEKRIPQDGRISLTLGDRALDVRVSTLPSRYGERVVMRLLDRHQAQFSLEDLGMAANTLRRFQRVLSEPNGIILVTGPTGSGKTTTLYAALARLNDQSRNILTVEDPVEYAIDGIGQTQVNSKVGMTFAAGLRAILRQDPDIVMVGEIRDGETAQIAVQASLTGHLVLSTVHTNSAIAAITRLRDMQVEPFLLSSTVKAIMAQRLVRRLCPACRRLEPSTDVERRQLGDRAPDSLYRAVGCPSCANTGYQGRVGLYELVTVDEDLRRLIHEDASEEALRQIAFRQAQSLQQAGFDQVLAGMTTVEEVLRVSGAADGGADGSL